MISAVIAVLDPKSAAMMVYRVSQGPTYTNLQDHIFPQISCIAIIGGSSPLQK